MIELEKLKELLNYNEGTGIFTWKKHKGVKYGTIAGTIRPDGYIQIGLLRKHYLAHRLAWFYVYGSWPIEEIDHINRVKNDNRIINLREATRLDNNINSNMPNETGYKGVRKTGKRFQSQINISSKQIYLGIFDTAEEAHQAYLAAAVERDIIYGRCKS